MEKEILFDKIHDRLVELLSKFEMSTLYETGVSHISGGFAVADFDNIQESDEDEEPDDPRIYFTLKWGIQNDCEDTVHTEHYYVYSSVLLSNEEIGSIIRGDLMEG